MNNMLQAAEDLNNALKNIALVSFLAAGLAVAAQAAQHTQPFLPKPALEAELPTQVVNHLLTASTATVLRPEESNDYTNLVQQA
ncbi:hypothetical protein [Leptolyngbya sp. FACHB-261]|uniref:hypothetical protein n=1 Tax=Leptolyngbya sp. FACHB-261 TaxID=2692806 RepID=UPI00168729B6|nr:hypothetical protein [Leptolyngbya sp. FACHB-261]MBD2101518.1 hypothetical protein [Leptolyngbya sp. FACHB-261]